MPFVKDTYAFAINGVFSPAQKYTTVGSLVTNIIYILLAAAASLSFIFIIIGGIKLVTSGGDSKKIGSAQGTLTYAIIGLLVSVMALVIVNLVERFLGPTVNVLQ